MGISPLNRKPTDTLEVQHERAHFRALKAKNPNYFGTMAGAGFEPVTTIIGDPSYEELHCLSFDPERNLLEATVHIKRSTGYGGGLCLDGSTEHVRAYIDYGSGWEDLGESCFNAHDIPDSVDCAKESTKPLVYVATLRIDPKPRCCAHPVLPVVRAILSWEDPPPPDSPDWVPVWGNVLDRSIQIKPRNWCLVDIIDSISDGIGKKLKLPPLFEEVQFDPIPLPDPPPESLASLVKLYSGRETVKPKADVKTSVEPHRFGLTQLQSALAPGSLNQAAIAAKIEDWKKLGLDWPGAVATLVDTTADVSYEQVECLGLDYNNERLVATFQVKRPYGYSGDLCSKGSTEYVAFWADWENECQWTYLNTVEVSVHDIQEVPPEGLWYAAILPVDLNKVRRSCKEPRLGRVRAVLSWQVPPSTTDPDKLEYWGNRLDAHVQIRPGKPVLKPSAMIRALGGIPLENIDTVGNGMTKPYGGVPAKFWFNDAPADPWNLNRPCPFGGGVIVHGMWFPGYKYRIRARKVTNPGVVVVLTTPFNVTKWAPGHTTQNADSLNPADAGYGFFTYLDPLLYMENSTLGVWSTSGDELWEVSLDLADMAYNVLDSTPWYRMQLDNTAPEVDIHIDNGGDCKGFGKADVLHGHFVARDLHFGAFALSTHPNTAAIPSNQPATPTTSTDATAVSPGDAWTLDLATPIKMKPCGYVVRVQAWDRTIVGSQSGGHNYNATETGFYILP